MPPHGAAMPLAAVLLLLRAAVVEAGWQYGMMVDAGSGGSRLHVYRWPPRQADPMRPLYAAITVPEEVMHFDMSPGISHFAHNISGIDGYMHGLLKQAEDGLQDLREQWYLIPIYFKATAGARDLYRDQRDAMFSRIRAILFECKFRFDSEYNARTISGEEEAVHAWLNVNAMTGTFRAENPANTWGALDMGGASTQIAFTPEDVSIIQNYYPLRISYLNIHTYSHSFLEFGYRDAHLRSVRMLINWTSNNGTKENPILHPCMSRGVFYALPLSEPFAAKAGEVRFVRGTGDFASCQNITDYLLHTDAPCFVPGNSRTFAVNINDRHGSCGINGVYEPRLKGRNFVAIGQYAKFAELMGVALNTKVVLSDLLPGMNRICSTVPAPTDFVAEIDDPDNTLREQGVQFVDPMSMPFARCWKTMWMYTVLTTGLRFPLDVPVIQFAKKLNGQKTGWALGAMMHEVNYFPWEQSSGFGLAAVQPPAAELARTRWLDLSGSQVVFIAALAAACMGLGVAGGWWAERRSCWCRGLFPAYQRQLLG